MSPTRIFRSGGFLAGLVLFAGIVGIYAAVNTPKLNLQDAPLSP